MDIIAPAIAWVYLSIFSDGMILNPKYEISTMPSMVSIVIPPKITVTSDRAKRLFFAAGYMSMGINGSQGPRIKIINSTHGVIFLLFDS